jgi:hypothetical protein
LTFHRQLERLCRHDARLAEALTTEIAGALHGRRVEPERHIEGADAGRLKGMFCFVPLKGFRFVPIVTRFHELSCGLDIEFLRREKPGDIVSGGDLDNRLKNLLDALRMPHQLDELKNIEPSAPGERLYCLLEDDALITRWSVATDYLLDPVLEGEKETDVHLRIRVSVESEYPMWANLGFPDR